VLDLDLNLRLVTGNVENLWIVEKSSGGYKQTTTDFVIATGVLIGWLIVLSK
jgi:hypothetical protein